MNKRLVKDGILAEGEVTGHKHRVEVQVVERDDLLREFDGPATVTHEEHAPITVPARRWVSGVVQETDHVADMVRPVRD